MSDASLNTVVLATFWLLPILVFLGSVFWALPKSFDFFQKWRRDHKYDHFSSAVFLGFGVLSFLIFSFVVWFNLLCKYEARISSPFLQILSVVVVAFLAHKLFIQKSLHHYEKWRQAKTSSHLSLMVLFGFFSLLFLSFIFLRLVISALKGGIDVL
jgi:hypothetical protein